MRSTMTTLFFFTMLTSAQVPDFREPGWKPLLNGKDLSGWRVVPNRATRPVSLTEWFTTTALSLADPPAAFRATPAPGPIAVNGLAARTCHLVSEETFGDVELYVEFNVTKGSNSGVYLHGLYEIQIFDSFGKQELASSDSGGIYQRWADNKGFEGRAPSKNVSRAPGEWQSFLIRFRAPRFENGRKVRDAEFESVVYNGVAIQGHYRCTGPTRAALEIPEAARNPLMLQGDHGPVAFRNIRIRNLR